MNLSLLLPSALAELAALALPVLIHLSRRSEQKLTDFAALRWLDAKLRPRRKLVFQERLLLALRLLLLLLIAFFLAQPVLLKQAQPSHWLLVVPGTDINAAPNLPQDKQVRRHWLAPGFPALDQQPKPGRIEVSSLLRELDASLPANTALTVVLPNQLSGLDAERLQLSREVDWRVVPGKMPARPLSATAPAPRLAIRHQPEHALELAYFRAVHSAWQSNLQASARTALDVASTQSGLPDKNATLLWLADGMLPKDAEQWIRAGGTALTARGTVLPALDWRDAPWRAANGRPLAKSAVLGKGRVWQWQQALTPQTMPELLEPDFPERLQSLLSPAARAPDQSLANMQKPRTGLPAWPERPEPLADWLVLSIGLLFVLERWMATAKKRWSGE